jgi:hypothetical protein
MEIPEDIKKLYRHFEKHVAHKQGGKSPFLDQAYEKKISRFIEERVNIWKKKTMGVLRPYTADEVMNTYRFCNIFREFDRQTIEFHKILLPIRDNFPLWLMNMFYFRLVANTDTVKKLGLMVFDEKENQKFYKRFTELEGVKFGVPYVFPVSVIMGSIYDTREKFISFYLPTIMEKISKEILSWNNISVVEAVPKIISIFHYQLFFLWTEVLIG